MPPKSPSTNSGYDPRQTPKNPISCPGRATAWYANVQTIRLGKADCKHIKVVLEQIRKNRAGTDDGFRMMARSEFTLCKFCDSGRLKKDGIRKNRKGDAQQYKCLDCKKRFTMNPGFERMRFKDVVITRALQMYYSGMSVRDIADCLEQEDVRVSHMTVYRWVEKYSRMTNEYVKGIVPRVSET